MWTPARIFMGHERDELVEYTEQADGHVTMNLLNMNCAGFLRFHGHLDEGRNSMTLRLSDVSDDRRFTVGIAQRNGDSLVLGNMRAWVQRDSIEVKLAPSGIDWDYYLSHPRHGYLMNFSKEE